MFETSRRSEGKSSASRRFPEKAQLIEELIARGGDFADMCEELADAEAALLSTEDLPPDLRPQRKAEWTGWIERLSKEIQRELAKTDASRSPDMTSP